MRLFGLEDALDSDAWYTPAWVFDGLGVTFDLDVAHPAEPLDWLPARHHYTMADDGLSEPWFGLVWCNPPYSAPTAWCYRWAEHPDGPAAAFAAASSLYVPAKRLQFVNGQGGKTGAVNFTSIILGRGDTADTAIERLAHSHGGMGRRLHQPVSVNR